MDNETMKRDFAAMVRATEICVRPWKIATTILSLVVVALTIIVVVK